MASHPSRLAVVLALLSSVFASLPIRAQAPPDPLAEVEALLQIPAVAGREEGARDFVRRRLGKLPAAQDKAGNVMLTIGSGEPRRLVVCPLGEPGLIVSRIEPDGYLRVVPVGAEGTGALWPQSFEGNTVVVGGARGWVAGGMVQRSVHLVQGGPERPDRPFGFEDAWIDVGAESAAEAEALVSRCARLVVPGGDIVIVDVLDELGQEIAHAAYGLHLAMRTQGGRAHPSCFLRACLGRAGCGEARLIDLSPEIESLGALLATR